MTNFNFNTKPYYDCADCIDAAFYSILEQDIRPKFANKFNFNYIQSPNGSILDTQIQTEYRKDNLLYNYSGLEFIEVYPSEIKIDLMEELLRANKILGVYFNNYYCCWSKYYKQLHRDHMILIIGIDKNKQLLHVYDKYLVNEPQVISYEDFNLGARAFIYYKKKSDKDNIMPQDLFRHSYELMTEAAEKDAVLDRKQKLDDFFKWIEQIDFKTGNLKTIDSSTFCLSMTYIWWSRLSYLDFLQWMNQFEALEHLICDLKKCSDLWLLFRNNVYKSLLYQKNILSERIKMLWPQIIDIESSCIDQIRNTVIKIDNERRI